MEFCLGLHFITWTFSSQNQLWIGLPTRLLTISRELISLAYLGDEDEAPNKSNEDSAIRHFVVPVSSGSTAAEVLVPGGC